MFRTLGRYAYTRTQDPEFIKYKAWCTNNDLTPYTKLNCINPSADLSWLKTNKPIIETQPWSHITQPHIPIIGVRNALTGVFRYLKTKHPNISAILPLDTYPVYHQISKDILPYTLYESMSDIRSWRAALKSTSSPQILLITNPSSPFGHPLPQQYLNLIQSWALNSNKWVFVDAVYNYTQSNPTLMGPRTFWCTSLSKTYLSPEQGGILTVPNTNLIDELKSYVTPPTTEANNIMTQNPFLPAKQQLLFTARWYALQNKYPDLFKTIPSNGYMHTIPMSFDTLLQKYNIISIPIQVFCGSYVPDPPSNKTIISCLNYKDEVNYGYYFTTVSNFAAGYDKYAHTWTKNKTYTYPHKFFLCPPDNLDPGITKAQKLLTKLNIPGDAIIAIGATHHNKIYERSYPILNSSSIDIHSIFIVEPQGIKSVTVEDVYSLSLKIISKNLYEWTNIIPRTISVLPIAKGCQAKCPFCFSHGSISQDQPSGDYMRNLSSFIQRSHAHNVQRAVITGGGEPTMLPHAKLVKLISELRSFQTVVLITNGYKYASMDESSRYQHLLELKNAGLTVLSISRHGATLKENTEIMRLEIPSERVAQTALHLLKVRWVCVLQKLGVSDRPSLLRYLSWAASTKVTEICFKELYVSSSHESIYYNSQSNEYARNNQVPMKLILNYVKEQDWTLVGTLPWGSPIYEGYYENHKFKIAIYTEPSVYWERSNGICRSWNIMSDGSSYASLESVNSVIS